jgi:methionine--tRNA ligase beta chain
MERKMITFTQFKEMELRVAKVKSAENHPQADRLLVLKIELAEGQERQVVAGIKQWYAPEALVGKTVIFVANLEPAMLRGVESQGMILAAHDAVSGNVTVLTTEKEVAAGSTVS